MAFVSGVGFATGGAVWSGTLQEKIPRESISRISSFDWFGSVALNPIGYALIGPLSTVIGVSESLVLTGLLNNPYRIQWSGLGDSTNWTSGSNSSDYQDLPDGGIVRGTAGG